MITVGNETFSVFDKCEHCKTQYSEEFLQSSVLTDAIKTQIAEHIKRYYAGWYTCEELACGHRTVRLSARLIHGQPLCPACMKAPLIAEYSERQLYEQLLAYKHAVTVNDTILSMAGLEDSLRHYSRQAHGEVAGVVNQYLSESLYARVSLSALFQKCMPTSRMVKKEATLPMVA